VHNIEMQITLSTGSNINTGDIAVNHDQEIIPLIGDKMLSPSRDIAINVTYYCPAPPPLSKLHLQFNHSITAPKPDARGSQVS
jgi:hypothetical protein